MTFDVSPGWRDERQAQDSLETQFSVVLARIIESIEEDPAQLRNAIYELARIMLQREAWQRIPAMDSSEIRRRTLALESAIERIETLASQQDKSRASPSPDRWINSPAASPYDSAAGPRDPILSVGLEPIATTGASHTPVSSAFAKRPPPMRTRIRAWPKSVPLIGTGVATILAVALYVFFDAKLGFFGSPPTPAVKPVAPAIQSADARPLNPVVAPPSPALPLPVAYGVYAISNGALNELEALVGRVPDQRVFMSTPINKPSRTILPDGRVVFITYRRDLSANALNRVAVRVIAKIARAMTFDPSGNAGTASLEDTWTVRSNSYDFRVAPVSENSEMLVIRPENADFVFPAGRYGLVLKGQAYDFSVAGPITDPIQCLERIEAANGAFYSECRPP